MRKKQLLYNIKHNKILEYDSIILLCFVNKKIFLEVIILMKRFKSEHYSSASRKLKIIKSALECFNENGFTQTSIGDVCKKSKTSVGSVYHHFKSKEQLAAAVYLEGIRQYQQGFIRALEKCKTAKEGIENIIRFHLDWVHNHQDWSRYLFHNRYAEFMISAEVDFEILNEEYYTKIAIWFKKHIELGNIRKLPSDLYSSIIMGPCQEYTRIFLSGKNSSNVDTASSVISSAVWRALCS